MFIQSQSTRPHTSRTAGARVKIIVFRLCALLFVSCALSQHASAQSWSGADIANSQNWSDGNNWAGNVAPSSGSAVVFPDGAFPVTTNVQGHANNIVQSSTAIASLTYNNAANDFDTTLIPSGSILTESGNFTVGGSVPSFVTITGGGSLVGGSGTSTMSVQSTSGTATLDLSTLSNFVFNAGGSGNTISLSTGSSSASGSINLAAGSNNITATTISLGNNNTGGSGTMNLGNGTNIINADTISIGIDKTTGTMQFLNNAGGGLKIANHTGTGRANINLSGQSGSGSTSAKINGSMLFNSGTVNILAGTLIVGNRGNRAQSGGNGSATGVLTFSNGVVDATTVIMATNTGSAAPVTGTITLGGGTLRVGTGGLILVNQGSANGATGTVLVANGTLAVTNSIFKGTSAGVATLALTNSSLIVGGTIGAINGIAIDNFSVTNCALTLAANTSANVLVNNFNPDATTQNTINISSLPGITGPFPVQFPIISYQVASGNLNTFVLGTLPGLPGTFSGYISNNTTYSSIDLVITSGPIAKADTWSGAVNTLWDTTTSNWLSSGVFTNYNDLDQVTFNDTASNRTVNIVGTRTPATVNGLTFNNYSLNYLLGGSGSISGPVQLVMNGAASTTLSESGGDNFSGGIQMNGGTLVLDDANSAISGGLTINSGTTVQIGNNDSNGTLPAGTLDDEGTLIFDRANNLSVGTVIPGGGALVQNGAGVLTLTAANTYSGNTTVNNGTLALSSGGSIVDSPNVDVTNATLDVSGVTTSATLSAVAISNTVVNLKVGYLQTNFNVSSLSMSGPSDTVNVRSLPPIAYYPATNGLIQSASPIVGNNFVLGTLPTASPAYSGSIALSSDSTALLLVLTAGPIGVRPAVTWSGADALSAVSTNWSDAQNWQSPGQPVIGEKVTFNDTADSGGTPFDQVGDGNGGIQSAGNIDNIVDVNSTNAGLNYANTGFHNTLINSGKTLLVNGSLTVNGSSGVASILGAGGALTISNTANSSVLNVDNSSAPTLDMSGLDTFTGVVNQIGVGFNSSSQGSSVNGTWYMARTNKITTGIGSSGVAAAMVIGGSTTQNAAGAGSVYLGQTNIFFIDGIVLGPGPSVADLMTFNPNVTNQNPGAYIRGTLGNSSRVTLWSLGDDTVNVNNNPGGYGQVVDLTGGTLNGLISTLVVGQGAQGNEFTANTIGTFNMGRGNMDVTTLDIGAGDNGKTGGTGIGIMNVTSGSLVVNSMALGVGGPTNTAGTLNLTNATLVLTNGISIGSGTAGGTLSVVSSTVQMLNNSTIGSSTVPLTTLNLDDATFELIANGDGATTNIAAGTVNSAGMTTLNLVSVTNVTGSAQIPLLSYTNNTIDPYPNLVLGSVPAGYTVGNGGALVDNAANQSIDVILNAVVTNPSTNANIIHVSLSGANLVIQGTNNNVPNTSFHYEVLTSTNLNVPLSNWTILSTNPFNSDGTFDYTNPIVPGAPRQFLDVKAVP